MTRVSDRAILGAALAGLVFFAVAMACAGCGSIMERYYQATAQGYTSATACYRAASRVNVAKELAIKNLATSSKYAEARAARDSWRPTYARVRKACDGLAVAAEAAAAAADSVKAATSRDADAVGWIARLATLGVEVAKALAEIGVKL